MTAKKQAVKSEQAVENPLAIVARPAELFKQATDVAGLCAEIVKKTAISIKGRKYVKVEGWEAIAAAHGFVAGARDVERTETGWKAIGELRRIADGTLIAQAEGFVGDDEPTWSGNEVRSARAEYAIRAMAQTRAISWVCRSAFAHVVVLIDTELSTTPAEEVPQDGFPDENKHSRTRAYELKTPEGDNKATSDLLELSSFLKDNNIPEGFVLAMLKEKKLVAPNLTKLGSAPPGVIRRTLTSRERLLKAYADSTTATTDNDQVKAEPKAEDEDQRMQVRQPCQTDVSVADLLEQEGVEWREVAIHFGKKKGERLSDVGAKNLVWWITKWTPTQYKGSWNDRDLLLDAALCAAHAEMAEVAGRSA